MECRLSEIVGARGSTVLKPLVSKRSKQARAPRGGSFRCGSATLFVLR